MKSTITAFYIPLEGVESEHCALIVNNGISRLSNVVAHRVELNNRQAVIETSDANGLTDVVKVIRGLGYGVTTTTRSFPVLQMTCASCAVNVENVLKDLPGVLEAHVNFVNAIVNVTYIPGTVQPNDFKKAVQNIGYDLLVDEDPSNGDNVEIIRTKNLNDLRIKTYWSLALSTPVVIIGMFFMNHPFANMVMWIMSTPVIVWLGKDFFINAWKQAKHLSANMDTLVALSTGVAYVFSTFNTLFPHFWHERGLHGHVYFEAAAVIISFILLGKLLEEKAKGNTSYALKKLIGLQPKTVTIISDGDRQEELPVDQVSIGNIILVKPGDKLAVDGTVVKGQSYVDESMISGEPIPVLKQPNDHVFAGTINQKGSFQFKAEKVGRETMLAQIIKMVQDAQGSKAPVQKLVDKIAGIFVPVVIGIAMLSFVIWIILGGENGLTHGLLSLITVLVIACPCALGLATPTAIMVGVGKGAENNILIKDAESLEMAQNINVVILDKTGTITEGEPMVVNEIWTNEQPIFKQIAFSLEKQSEHPLAMAIANHLNAHERVSIDYFESITGKGAKAEINKETFFIGNKKLINEYHVLMDETLESKATQWANESKTVVFFSDSKTVLAAFAIADQLKSGSREAIKSLKDSGIEVHMLTGDNEATAKTVAGLVNIQHYQSEVLPEEKARYVRKLQEDGKVVAMVGDGINDSSALATADVSIAMGKGSDIAIDVARMTIISSDLRKIPEAIRLSKATVKTIKQNLFWAFVYNLIGIPVAAGILYPINGFLLNPMIAGAAMALSSVSVISNSLRLRYFH